MLKCPFPFQPRRPYSASPPPLPRRAPPAPLASRTNPTLAVQHIRQIAGVVGSEVAFAKFRQQHHVARVPACGEGGRAGRRRAVGGCAAGSVRAGGAGCRTPRHALIRVPEARTRHERVVAIIVTILEQSALQQWSRRGAVLGLARAGGVVPACRLPPPSRHTCPARTSACGASPGCALAPAEMNAGRRWVRRRLAVLSHVASLDRAAGGTGFYGHLALRSTKSTPMHLLQTPPLPAARPHPDRRTTLFSAAPAALKPLLWHAGRRGRGRSALVGWATMLRAGRRRRSGDSLS